VSNPMAMTTTRGSRKSTPAKPLAKEKINATQHFTEPPPRYSEASLIRKMEELGIGRPSTYASTLATLRDREYVVIDKRRLIPEPKGRLVIAFLENFFERYVEFGFTADLEEKLDRISAGELAWKDVLREFWVEFHSHIDETKDLRVSQVLDALNEALAPLVFPVNAKMGPTRASARHAEPATCRSSSANTEHLSAARTILIATSPDSFRPIRMRPVTLPFPMSPRILATDPHTEEPITLRTGRFGPYVQRGDGKEAKRSSLPKGWAVDSRSIMKRPWRF
jgi:DNA topoisomerase-1